MKPTKPFANMTTAELAEATKQYEEMVIDKTFPLNAKERKIWEKAKNGRGQRKAGKGAKKISISLEGDMLQRADALAKKRGVNRSELITGLVMSGLRRRAI
ncbi:MAG: ribbon-helix-helix domain-containing protein [Tepidisphaeraceae bacterium]|jgi:hypothetical protein